MWVRVWGGLTVLIVAVVAGALVASTVLPVRASPRQAEAPAAAGGAVAQAAAPRVVLKFLTITDDAQINAWKEILQEFRKIEGGKWAHVDLAFESVPFQDLFPKIESAVAAGAQMDLVQSDGPDMKHYAGHRLLHLPERLPLPGHGVRRRHLHGDPGHPAGGERRADAAAAQRGGVLR